MATEPMVGLVFHLFSTPRPHLDLLVASGIFICTVIYMTRIAGISVSYGMDDTNSDPNATVEAANQDKPYDGPYLAG